MKTVKMLTILVLALAIIFTWPAVSEAQWPPEPMGSAFTYQGHLYDANHVSNGEYDFEFKLFVDPCKTGPPYHIGDPVTIYNLDVIDGYFTVELDFNHPYAFGGFAHWLEIGVRPGELEDPNEYTILSPRQELTPAPYAINADKLDGASSSSFAGALHTHSGSDITSGTVDEGYIDTDITRDTELTSGLATKADISHNHDGSDIVSGTVTAAHIDTAMATDSELSTGLATKADIGHDHDPCYVNVTGDSMSDTLSITSSGTFGLEASAAGSAGRGVYGRSSASDGHGVYGYASDSGTSIKFGGYFKANGSSGRGVYGQASKTGTSENYGGYFVAAGETGRGVYGTVAGGQARGVEGYAANSGSLVHYGGYFKANGDNGVGVYGDSDDGTAVHGKSTNGHGVHGQSVDSNGVCGESTYGQGVYGKHNGSDNYGYLGGALHGVEGGGLSGNGIGVFGWSNAANGKGVFGWSNYDGEGAIAVYGYASSSNDVTNYGGYFTADGNYGYGGYFNATGTESTGIVASGGLYAAQFHGDVLITTGRVTTPVLEITGGSDVSEQFEIGSESGEAKAGMVVCIDAANPGNLVVSSKAYDRRVAGIISGAGGVKPGMLMGQKGTEADGEHPVALTGRVYCQADASNGPIEPGDLLTSSETAGHAMKVTNYDKAQGAILGKAMTPLVVGQGLVLVLVNLQ